jgi:hypothetical protein
MVKFTSSNHYSSVLLNTICDPVAMAQFTVGHVAVCSLYIGSSPYINNKSVHTAGYKR